MSLRVRVITRPGFATGFRLVGLPVDEATNAQMAGDGIAAAAAHGDVGILLVDQALLDELPAAQRRDAERRPVPVLVPIPAPAWTEAGGGAEDFLIELLRRTIGYRVRLQ
jgi:vacuolar-type H+-ATPase subunit F/Vma7